MSYRVQGGVPQPQVSIRVGPNHLCLAESGVEFHNLRCLDRNSVTSGEYKGAHVSGTRRITVSWCECSFRRIKIRSHSTSDADYGLYYLVRECSDADFTLGSR